MIILAVDPDTAALERLSACLRAVYPDSEIVTFSDPLLAVKYGYNHSIDVLFAEIEMKGMGGFDIARLIRNSRKGETPVSVNFVTSTEEYRTDALRFLADGYLRKPVDEDAIRGLSKSSAF